MVKCRAVQKFNRGNFDELSTIHQEIPQNFT